jgi:hypothetical protein
MVQTRSPLSTPSVVLPGGVLVPSTNLFLQPGSSHGSHQATTRPETRAGIDTTAMLKCISELSSLFYQFGFLVALASV